MRQHRTTQQLDLPCSLTEATHLHEDLARLQQTCTHWQEYAHELERHMHTFRQERDAARREVADLQLLVNTHKFLLELQSDRVRTTPEAVPAWVSQELRRLLATCHPDRWSAGQSAATLAHDMSTAVNALRQRLEGQS